MLIDESNLVVTSGAGGDGRVSFFAGRGKPSGGDGGTGGSVFAVVDAHLTSLGAYTKHPHRTALNGGPGGTSTKKGKNAQDLILRFPVGTMLTDLETHEEIVLDEGADPLLVCRGGKGGWGNSHYSQVHHGVFAQALPGRPGEVRRFRVVMRLIADCGLIGLPNAGKSSLLNVLTNAQSKVADYPFTTLEPNLGILKAPHTKHVAKPLERATGDGSESKKIVVADIPGLIEGASEGKGIGDKFLRHIEKVKVLVHCISSETTNLTEDYRTIRHELESYNPELLHKPEIIVLTKTDILGDDTSIQDRVCTAQRLAPVVVPTSVLEDATISRLVAAITSAC